MTISVTPFDQGLGAFISDVRLHEPVSAQDQSDIMDAFAEHHVLAFRDQLGLTTDEVLTASRLFGDDLEEHVFTQYHHPQEPLILVLSNRINQGKEEGLKDAGTFWHSDVAYKPEPAMATLLYALEIPDEGGDTLFCDLTRAYDDLSENMKSRLAGLKAWHFYANHKRDLFDNGQIESPPECLHPVIRTNPVSGRKAIYITPAYTVRIDGMTENQSQSLMQGIFEHCLQDKYRMSYKWRAGDMLVWDNAAVMHSATTKDLDPSKTRVIWRTIISGEAAY